MVFGFMESPQKNLRARLPALPSMWNRSTYQTPGNMNLNSKLVKPKKESNSSRLEHAIRRHPAGPSTTFPRLSELGYLGYVGLSRSKGIKIRRRSHGNRLAATFKQAPISTSVKLISRLHKPQLETQLATNNRNAFVRQHHNQFYCLRSITKQI